MLARNLLYYASVVLLVGMLVYGAYLRFSYPDMTDIRFFLTYWYLLPVYICAIIVAGLLNWWRESGHN